MRNIVIIFCAGFFAACQKQHDDQEALFEVLLPETTGIDFRNTLTPSKELNVFNYMYFYNGGGVAVADFNNDGLVDIFFTANMEDNALYLNQGDMRFINVTEEAGLKGIPGWTTGAVAVDVNSDGLMDIYVSQVSNYRDLTGANQLYICKGINERGIPVYVDEAGAYGLDLVGFGTQAVFFDFDLDGDLDMYMLNHSVHNNGTFGQRHTFLDKMHPYSGDRLFRNDNGRYVDVTAESGIYSTVISYGLGVVITDINNDGWPDIYICNDFHENDYLYINQRDGTFREVLTDQMNHTSRFSMGVDVADINGNGLQDIITLDMHPYDPFILKSSLGEDGFDVFQFKLGYGYNHQYARNNLQLNNGDHSFSEIGIFSGVHATDWSWAALFLDFDEDGYKDLFISNGIPKRMNDIDYINHISNEDIQWKIKVDEFDEADLILEERLPEIKLPNKFYRNTGKLQFENITKSIHQPLSFSTGAAFADFDNDGDMDIVVNNINDGPVIYRNLTRERQSRNHFIGLRLRGSTTNPGAIGAKLIAYTGEIQMSSELYPVRGYQSSVDYMLHIGLGRSLPDSIILIWPDHTYQRLEHDVIDTVSVISWKPGLKKYQFTHQKEPKWKNYLYDYTQQSGIDYKHEENPFVEFLREQLMPHMVSSEGPALAVADINGDGLDDIFIGSAKHGIPVVYLQNTNGTFDLSDQPDLRRDSIYEDVDAIFADINGNGFPDLCIASGGNEFYGESEPMRPRIYINDGTGLFRRKFDAIPELYMTASCIASADFDGDGHIDLFIGGRAVPWNYGITPASYLLKNDGTGRFVDVTDMLAPSLRYAGLVTDASWVDLDLNGNPDLVLALEWGAVTVFRNDDGHFSEPISISEDGWWTSLYIHDFNQNGYPDIIAGNFGLNTKLKPSSQYPVTMYINDFDDNGQIEQVITYYLHGQEILLPMYSEVIKQLPNLKKRYLFAKDFAAATLHEMFGHDRLRKSERKEATQFAHMYFSNKGSMEFQAMELPLRIQFAPLQAAVAIDVNQDGWKDLVTVGNFFETNIELGRYDADYGNLLINAQGNILEGELMLLGLKGQFRKATTLNIIGQESMILVRNDDTPVILQVKMQKQPL